jgi:hypothetical protein
MLRVRIWHVTATTTTNHVTAICQSAMTFMYHSFAALFLEETKH